MRRHSPVTQRAYQQKLDELRHQLRYASSEQERQTLITQIDFWRRHI
jgi:hypothetical protein